ncbi:MAG TPA: squalene synthase HpnC [Tepidisphaeraceae bacterium]|jgi:squalene synthase HpnC
MTSEGQTLLETCSTTRRLPPAVRDGLSSAGSLRAAEEVAARLTREHYENFSVISWVLPRHLRQDFCNIYAFCRVADDLSDEVHAPEVSLDLLDRFREQTRACYAGENCNAVFTALSGTIQRHDIPIDPFLDLISAFEQDQRVRRYETFEDLLGYCRGSANPVGRLVLYVCGYRDVERQRLSDFTCTALQLTNFWQDVRRDLADLGRIYLPLESMRRFAVTEQQLHDVRCDDNYRALIRFEVNRAEGMFDEGEKLLPLLDSSVRPQISLFGRGGRAILQAIRDQNYDTLTHRPVLSRWQKGRLLLSALMAPLGSRHGNGRASA